MTDKQKQEMLSNENKNWLAYIKASLAMANTNKGENMTMIILDTIERFIPIIFIANSVWKG
jgi:hypothetical protein